MPTFAIICCEMFIPWSTPDFGQDEKSAAIRVVKSGWLTQGKETSSFEKELTRYLGVKYAIVLNSGTSALIASLLAHDIGPGDEVVVPAFTFIATVNSIISVGAKPILADCDLNTWNISPESVEKYITKRTKAIMPVDVAGMSIDINGFRKLCRMRRLVLIEDAAQAIGSEYLGKKIGSFGHTTIFSFHMAKLVTTVEGGCVVTNDKRIANRVMMARNHGRSEFYNPKKHGTEYQFDGFGLNFRISDVLSAVGRIQLKKIDKAIRHREKLVKYYKKNLVGMYEFQEIPAYATKHTNMIFALLTKEGKRDSTNKILYEAGVSTRITWLPAYRQRWHSQFFNKLSFKNTESISKRIISLPLGNKTTLNEVKKVIKILKKI